MKGISIMHKSLPKFNDASVHFITTKTHKNKPYFLDEKCCDILIKELNFYRKHYKFKILGYTIIPDHLHLLIWWDSEENKDLTISKIIQGVKSYSAKKILEYLGKRISKELGQGTRPTHDADKALGQVTQATLDMDKGSGQVNQPTHDADEELGQVTQSTLSAGVTQATHAKGSGQVTRPTLLQVSQSTPDTMEQYSPGRQGHLTLSKKYPSRRISNPKYKIWQNGFYDFNILYEEKLWEKLEYLHENPFKDRRIKKPENYLYCSKLFYETGKSTLPIDSPDNI